jgi:hypothetical protein
MKRRELLQLGVGGSVAPGTGGRPATASGAQAPGSGQGRLPPVPPAPDSVANLAEMSVEDWTEPWIWRPADWPDQPLALNIVGNPHPPRATSPGNKFTPPYSFNGSSPRVPARSPQAGVARATDNENDESNRDDRSSRRDRRGARHRASPQVLHSGNGVDGHDDQDSVRHGPELPAVSGWQFKKAEEAQIKAGFQKSYKILRTMDDGGAWNLLILREYTSLASIETNQEKADALLQQTDGDDQAQMRGYEIAASTVRSLVPNTRELVPK